jgi:hypothetical protein
MRNQRSHWLQHSCSLISIAHHLRAASRRVQDLGYPAIDNEFETMAARLVVLAGEANEVAESMRSSNKPEGK